MQSQTACTSSACWVCLLHIYAAGNCLVAILTADLTYHVVPEQSQQPARDDADYLLHPLQGTGLLSAILLVATHSTHTSWHISDVRPTSLCTGLQA